MHTTPVRAFRIPFALAAALVILAAVAAPASAGSSKSTSLSGFLDFRKGNLIIVDAQRVEATGKTKFTGGGKAKSLATTPLGYELKIKGDRRADGVVVAREITAKKNGMSFGEEDLINGTNQAEQAYVKAKKVYEPGPDGKEQVLGALHTDGPQVERCRRIVDRLLPSYIDPKTPRIYVVDNKEWNAMAMANYSIYVFSGLMADMDDDELAIVIGHELAHATQEHSRKQASKSMVSGIAGQVAAVGSEMIGNDLLKSAAQGATALGVTTFGNAYSREYEDQADRVGLRYVYEAGYDVSKAPNLWRRFAAKYPEGSKVENFFFGNHSLSTERAHDLEKEIKTNYADAKVDPLTHARTSATG